jgi:hypothetical protein
VMVLYVFVVSYIGGTEELSGGVVLRILGPLFAFALAVELCLAMLGSALKGINTKGAPYVPGFGTPRHIGQLFLTTYLFPFEVASLLLLVAAIGAVVLARRRRGLEEDEQPDVHVRVPRSAYTGTIAAIGAVVLARRRRGLIPDEELAARIAAPRAQGTGTMAEAGGIRESISVIEALRMSPGELRHRERKEDEEPPMTAPTPGPQQEGGW